MDTDEAGSRDFHEGGVLRARITPTHLVVFSTHLPPAQYPLQKISAVVPINLPGGQTAVAMEVDDLPASPGLTFNDPNVASSFTRELFDAIEGLRE